MPITKRKRIRRANTINRVWRPRAKLPYIPKSNSRFLCPDCISGRCVNPRVYCTKYREEIKAKIIVCHRFRDRLLVEYGF